jgi:hypothetical protein
LDKHEPELAENEQDDRFDEPGSNIEFVKKRHTSSARLVMVVINSLFMQVHCSSEGYQKQLSMG